MAVVTVTRYTCDVCKSEFKEPEALAKVELPYKQYDSEGRNYSWQFKRFDLCNKCKDKYIAIMAGKFAVISECFGTEKVSRYS